MIKTPIPLYRQGNTTSPRMDKVRVDRDIATFEDAGVIWVLETISDNRPPAKVKESCKIDINSAN
jgi:hypothetical protein